MAELIQGVPYTDPSADTVTEQVQADRSEAIPRTFTVQHDYGQARDLTTAEVTVQAADLTIVGGTLMAADEIIHRVTLQIVNFTGGAITFRIRPKTNTTAVSDHTISLGALSGQTVLIENVVTVAGITPASEIYANVAINASAAAAAGSAFADATPASTPLTLDTTADLDFNCTVVMSAATAGIATTGQVASLRVIPA